MAANPAPLPPTAAPAAPRAPFFVPAGPAPIASITETTGEGADGRSHETRGRRHRHRPDEASDPSRRERWEHRRRKGDHSPRGDKPPAAGDRPPSGDQPVASGDKPTPAPATPTPAPAGNAAPPTPAPTISADVPAGPIAPVVVPRPGAPSTTMLGLGAREMIVNQLVAIVPIPRDGDLANDYGLSVDEEATIRSLGVRLVTFTVLRPRGLGDTIDLMGLDSRVQGAQPNFRYRTSGAVGGVYPQDRLRLQPALGMASGAGVTVALIDTKVAEVTSLIGHVSERLSVISNGGRGRHGTALAGLIADVAPSARLLSIEAFADDSGDPDVGVSTTINLARAIDAAIDRKADVINLSIAGPRDPLIGRLVRQALSRGIVVVAAAGNDGPDAPPRYPAAYDGVIAVTATDPKNQPYAEGAQGSHVVVAAPGVDVRATVSEGVVGYVTGTSVAAAQVSGVAALLRERAPKLGSGEARRIFRDTASPLPAGPGMVDAFAAVTKVTALAGR
ncbi:MAG: S8 family serine peptidase [Rhodospirillaceae bacterium]|nr:S8 family serine peptidase [Rhodospirillaceae bacterium]